jgi:hypothetical protein
MPRPKKTEAVVSPQVPEVTEAPKKVAKKATKKVATVTEPPTPDVTEPAKKRATKKTVAAPEAPEAPEAPKKREAKQAKRATKKAQEVPEIEDSLNEFPNDDDPMPHIDLDFLIRPNPKYDISNEPDIRIDLNKVLKFKPTDNSGNVVDEPELTFYMIPYGPGPSDYDVMSLQEMQVMVNAQILENHFKIERIKRSSPGGEEEIFNTENIFKIARLMAWKSLTMEGRRRKN